MTSFDEETLKHAEAKYGNGAATRLQAWETMVRTMDREKPDLEKLEIVNRFFNGQIRYATDAEVWGIKEYWATPFEFLCRNAGDCEDFAIAKFFTLKEVGVQEEKLNIMYGKRIAFNRAHMVLGYYSEPEAEPLILGNIRDDIVPASNRTDLRLSLGFNTRGLWSVNQRAERGSALAAACRLKEWRNLQKRMAEQGREKTA